MNFSRYTGNYPLSRLQRLFLIGYSSVGGFLFPKRGEMVSILGETTTPEFVLKKLHKKMLNDDTGKIILQKKPIVDKTSINFDMLSNLPNYSFGKQYHSYMSKYGFSPDGRDPIIYIDDPELAYVLLRYRQIHDFLHVLSGLPASIEGETALKIFEFIQTGIPMTLLASIAGCIRSNHVNINQSMNVARRSKDVMCIMYEDHFNKPIDEFRHELNIFSS